MLVVWSIGRLNFGLLLNLTAIIFLLVSIISNSAPGWFIWAVPFLVLFEANLRFKDLTLIILFCYYTSFHYLLFGPFQLDAITYNFIETNNIKDIS